jgi:hypothetical protein
MKPVARRKRSPRKSLLTQLVENSSGHVLMESTRAAIEKMAEEFVKESMADPEFRALVRRESREAVRKLVAGLRKDNPKLHGRPES